MRRAKGTKLAFNTGMECFFGSYRLPEKNPAQSATGGAVVIFAIPELGIKFKAPFKGVDNDHNDYASLLALLEFIDGNQKFFSNNTYQIYGNNQKIINQINNREASPPQFSGLLEKARTYRKKYRFSLEWVAQNANPAFQHLLD